MKHLWILVVAVGLLVAGTFSFISHSASPVTNAPEAVAPVTVPVAQPALALAGFPSLTPPAQSPQSHGIHVLPDAAEVAETNAHLSNKHFIDRAGELLMADTKAFDRKNEIVRMRAVAFLANSAHWTGNPERAAVFATINESIEKDNATTPSESRQRKSIAGDKVELFEILMREAPEQAQAVEARSEGTWLQPILHHAHERFVRYTSLHAAR